MERLTVKGIAIITLSTLFLLEACTSRTQLTPATAKTMLSEGLRNSKKNSFLVGFYQINGLLNQRTFENLAAGAYPPNSLQSQVQRLLQAGYIVESSESLTFPNITGTYKGTRDIYSAHWNLDMTVAVQPGSPNVTGQFRFESRYQPSGQLAETHWGPVTGVLNPNQTVTLSYGEMRNRSDYRVSVEGNALEIIGPVFPGAGNQEITLKGTGPGGSITAARYSYSFSPKFLQLADQSRMQINGGPIEVDDVSRLLLTTETIAAAEFAWHVKFNGAARILTGKDSQTGRGTVEFGKQPDGTWVLASFDL